MPESIVIGIDIAKQTFDAALGVSGSIKTFANDDAADLLDSAGARFLARYDLPLEALQADDEAALNRLLEAQLPASVELEVTQTEPGERGNTASGGGNKPATLETGAVVREV